MCHPCQYHYSCCIFGFYFCMVYFCFSCLVVQGGTRKVPHISWWVVVFILKNKKYFWYFLTKNCKNFCMSSVVFVFVSYLLSFICNCRKCTENEVMLDTLFLYICVTETMFFCSIIVFLLLLLIRLLIMITKFTI